MSIGRMNTFISICKPTVGKDDEGFPTKNDGVIANIRAYREARQREMGKPCCVLGSNRPIPLSVYPRYRNCRRYGDFMRLSSF